MAYPTLHALKSLFLKQRNDGGTAQLPHSQKNDPKPYIYKLKFYFINNYGRLN